MSVHGFPRRVGRVTLIIFVYQDNYSKYMTSLLLQVHWCGKTLPIQLCSFLKRNDLTFFGSNIGGNISKIGRDFKYSKGYEESRLFESWEFFSRARCC